MIVAVKEDDEEELQGSEEEDNGYNYYTAIDLDYVASLASVSRLYYPTLSLVSKSFRSVLASPELYKFRSLLGYTESCLYVCISTYAYPRWFTLCWKPNRNDTGYFLTEAPVPCNRYADFSNLVAVGSDIYTIGESASSSRVSILDCTSHTWRHGPSLPVQLLSLTASVIDRKIYVAGCSRDCGSKNSFHVLDTTTQIWDPKPIPCREAKETFLRSKSASVEGKFHVITSNEEVAYNSKEGRWDLVRLVGYPSVPPRMGHYLSSTDSYCEIGNVLFCVLYGVIWWYDTKERKWRRVEGLVGLPKLFPNNCLRLADYGGKMAVLWEQCHPSLFTRSDFTIWCAVIELERRESCVIWGKVEWCDYVLTIPSTCGLVKALSATL